MSYVVGRSMRKTWGRLFTCMASRAVHEEIVTSLRLKDFLLAFSRFNDVRAKVEVIYSDNGTTVQAAAKTLSKLLHTTEYRNAFREKRSSMVIYPSVCPVTRRHQGVDSETV